MKNSISILASVLVLLATPGVFAGHFEGEETNVVIIECYVPMKRVQKTFKGQKYQTYEPEKPAEIRVRAISFNATTAPIPTVTTNNTCAQALHEYLTAGFELVRDVSLGEHVYMLTRRDKSKSAH